MERKTLKGRSHVVRSGVSGAETRGSAGSVNDPKLNQLLNANRKSFCREVIQAYTKVRASLYTQPVTQRPEKNAAVPEVDARGHYRLTAVFRYMCSASVFVVYI